MKGIRFFVVMITYVLLGTSSYLCAMERNIQLLSTSTGSGNLAVRVVYPDSPLDYRYPHGSPILVYSPGGHEPGSLTTNGPFEEFGFTVISFLFPGGSDGAYASDGIYDYRGENSILAMRDVLQYALGLKVDIMGNTIQDLFPGTVLVDNVGIIAGSNGGPTATATLSLHYTDLPDIRYLVHMESPTSDQTVCGDLGNVGFDCDHFIDGDGNGLPRDDGKNMHYTAYGTSSCTVDFTNLAWDASSSRTYTDPAGVNAPVTLPGVVFLDNNGNGVVDSVGSPPCYDTNGNNRLDPTEDYPFSGKTTFTDTGDVVVFLSTEVTEAAANNGIFSGPWPDHIASPSASDAFWNYRDSTLHFASVAAAYPDFGVLQVFTESDHVQCADDHPHIQQCYDGYRSQGTWSRLNPDLAYIEYVSGSSAPVGTQDTDANATVAPGTMKLYSNPESIDGFVAGACEMADRVQYGEWSANLDSVIAGPTPTPSPTWTPAPQDWPPLYVVSMMHAEESRPFHENQSMFDDHATSLRALSDLFASHGAKIEVGPDWTFIRGVQNFDPTLLTDLLATGHGIHTHAHETQYDLGEVNAMLHSAGVAGNQIGNGGWLESGPGGSNWVGYISDYRDVDRNQLFKVAVGYKNPDTQEIHGLGHAFRPSVTGDWTQHDPGGQLIYLGCNMSVDDGANIDFETIIDWMNHVLSQIDPDAVNTMYWHDSVHNYGDPLVAQERMDLWETLLSNYFDHLVAAGRIEWKTFTEMGEIYRQWEAIHCGETGVTIRMPYPEFVAGDPCWCQVDVCNAGDSPLVNHPLFVILDVYGSLFFAPSFGDFDSYLGTYPEFGPGRTTVDVLPVFAWPDEAGSAYGLQWIAALTDPEVTQIVGNWDRYDFAYN